MATTAAPVRHAAGRRHTARTPTLGDAEKVAAVIAAADPRVEQILVFGSVARGDARPQSDIDLLVLLGDEPGPPTRAVRSRLERIAGEQSPWPVELVVKRRVAYEHLARNVTASFAHAIAAETRAVFEAGPLPPPTGNLDGVPRTNLDIARADAAGAASALVSLSDTISRIGTREDAMSAAEQGSAAIADTRRGRYLTLLAGAHMSIERSIKAAAAATGVPRRRLHQFDRLLDAMGDTPKTRQLRAAVDPIRKPDGELTNWRVSAYDDDDEEGADEDGHEPAAAPPEPDEVTPHNASVHLRAAIAAARIAADTLRAHAETDPQRRAADALADAADEAETLHTDPDSLQTGPPRRQAPARRLSRWWRRTTTPTDRRTPAAGGLRPSQALPARRRRTAKCGRQVASTGKPCQLKADHRGRCRSRFGRHRRRR